MNAPEGLSTTVVGSFSARPSGKTLEGSYHDGRDPFEESVRECIELQTGAGIDIVSDGQTRSDMVRLFASGIGGIRMRSRPVVIGELEYDGPITLEDQRLARTMLGDGQMLKGIITGPFTMASSCVDEHYGDREALAFAFAEVLNKEALAIGEVVDMVQVDEPFLSVECPEVARDLVSTVLKGVERPRALHVCGDVSRIFEGLVEFPVDIMDHEFAAHPELLDAVKDVDFGQTLGFGCVRSDTSEVESVQTILERVKKGIDCIGQGRLILDPDCGLRHVSMNIARGKLENMVRARDVMRDESGDH